MRDPIGVYFCHIPQDRPEAPFRNYLARACLERWRNDALARIVLLQPTGTAPLAADVEVVDAGPVERFHMARYRIPQARAGGAWFVVADDDCLPIGDDFIGRARAVAEAHPQYGVLAASDVVGTGPSDPQHKGVAESYAVGGICFVAPTCPVFDYDVNHPTFADGARYQQVKAAGLLEGRIIGVRMNHLGCNFSISVAGYWGVP